MRTAIEALKKSLLPLMLSMSLGAYSAEICILPMLCPKVPVAVCDSLANELEIELVGLNRMRVIPKEAVPPQLDKLGITPAEHFFDDSVLSRIAPAVKVRYLLSTSIRELNGAVSAGFSLFDADSTKTIAVVSGTYASFESGLLPWAKGLMLEMVNDKIVAPAIREEKARGDAARAEAEMELMRAKRRRVITTMTVTGMVSAVSVTIAVIAILISHSGLGG